MSVTLNVEYGGWWSGARCGSATHLIFSIVESTNSGAEYNEIRKSRTKGVNLTLPDVKISEVCAFL